MIKRNSRNKLEDRLVTSGTSALGKPLLRDRSFWNFSNKDDN